MTGSALLPDPPSRGVAVLPQTRIPLPSYGTAAVTGTPDPMPVALGLYAVHQLTSAALAAALRHDAGLLRRLCHVGRLQREVARVNGRHEDLRRYDAVVRCAERALAPADRRG